MITITNASNDECLKSLKNYFKNETRKYSLYLIAENGIATYDYDPAGLKREFKKVETKLMLDLHGIIEDIQEKLDDFWFWPTKKAPEVTLFKFNVLLEYLQMRRYKNPGIDFDNPTTQTIIIYHLENEKTHDIHCQIVGVSALHPTHPDFFDTVKLSVNTFLNHH